MLQALAAPHVRHATQDIARLVPAAQDATCALQATIQLTAAQHARHAAQATALLVLVRLFVLYVTQDIPELVRMV